MTFSDIVGLKIISVYDKKILGYVVDALYSQKAQKITDIIVSDSLEETTKILNTRNILSINKDFILIANSTVLTLSQTQKPKCGNIVNKILICITGESFGKVKQINIDEKFNIKSIESDNKLFTVKDIYGVGDIVLIKDPTKSRQRSFAPKTNIEKPEKAQTQIVTVEPITPLAVKVQPNGLIGKRLKRDFIVLGNRILARKNTAITNDLILTAKRLNVLHELELLSF